MARGAAQSTQGGEGAYAAWRRAGAEAPGVAVGSGRKGISVRDRRGSVPTIASASVPMSSYATEQLPTRERLEAIWPGWPFLPEHIWDWSRYANLSPRKAGGERLRSRG